MAVSYDRLSGQMIDSRDLIEWLEQDYDEDDPDNDHDMARAIRDMEGEVTDWEYGATLIREDYFVEYAQELAEDIGAIDSEAGWPAYCIDWTRAADELKMDYSCVEFMGHHYYVLA